MGFVKGGYKICVSFSGQLIFEETANARSLDKKCRARKESSGLANDKMQPFRSMQIFIAGEAIIRPAVDESRFCAVLQDLHA
jgi:hypothetical protein